MTNSKNIMNDPSSLAVMKLVESLKLARGNDEIIQALLFIGTSLLRELGIPEANKCQILEVMHSLLHVERTPAWEGLKNAEAGPQN